jgi:hypothetical protein
MLYIGDQVWTASVKHVEDLSKCIELFIKTAAADAENVLHKAVAWAEEKFGWEAIVLNAQVLSGMLTTGMSQTAWYLDNSATNFWKDWMSSVQSTLDTNLQDWINKLKSRGAMPAQSITGLASAVATNPLNSISQRHQARANFMTNILLANSSLIASATPRRFEADSPFAPLASIIENNSDSINQQAASIWRAATPEKQTLESFLDNGATVALEGAKKFTDVLMPLISGGVTDLLGGCSSYIASINKSLTSPVSIPILDYFWQAGGATSKMTLADVLCLSHAVSMTVLYRAVSPALSKSNSSEVENVFGPFSQSDLQMLRAIPQIQTSNATEAIAAYTGWLRLIMRDAQLAYALLSVPYGILDVTLDVIATITSSGVSIEGLATVSWIYFLLEVLLFIVGTAAQIVASEGNDSQMAIWSATCVIAVIYFDAIALSGGTLSRFVTNVGPVVSSGLGGLSFALNWGISLSMVLNSKNTTVQEAASIAELLLAPQPLLWQFLVMFGELGEFTYEISTAVAASAIAAIDTLGDVGGGTICHAIACDLIPVVEPNTVNS